MPKAAKKPAPKAAKELTPTDLADRVTRSVVKLEAAVIADPADAISQGAAECYRFLCDLENKVAEARERARQVLLGKRTDPTLQVEEGPLGFTYNVQEKSNPKWKDEAIIAAKAAAEAAGTVFKEAAYLTAIAAKYPKSQVITPKVFDKAGPVG